MASDNQSVDELILCLVNMGFELEDCQEAVQHGKLSVEAAIEWILAGKPAAPASSGPATLHLGAPGVMGATNPFNTAGPASPPTSPLAVTPQSSQAPQPRDSGAEGAQGREGSEEEKVVSRSHLNEEQRRIRDRFEERQREEAKKAARDERLAKKRAHEAALRQIQEDRERQRMKRNVPAQPEAATSQGQGSQSAGQGSQSTGQGSSSAGSGASPSQPISALLQIRLPQGQPLKQNFEADHTLQKVWDFVQEKYKNCANMCLMQPFPRQEFGEEHMGHTLRQLGLVPTGSLVLLQRREAPSPPSTNDSPMKEVATSSPEENFPLPPMPPPLGGVAPPPPPHQWGSGNKLEGQEGSGEPSGGSDDGQMEEEEGEEEEEEDEEGDAPPLPQHHWAPPPHHGQDPFGQDHPWGYGERLMGEVLMPDRFPHHSRDPKLLAAEKARERYAAAPEFGVGEDEGAEGPAQTQEVACLAKLVLRHLGSRLCDPRQPLLGLQGLPSDTASTLIDHLLWERLLRPRTLQPFISCHLRKLILDCYPYTTNELLAAIRLHTYLTHLSLRSCPLITDKGLQAINSLKRLRILNLGGNAQLTNNCLAIVPELGSLQVLVLESTGVTDDGVCDLLQSPPASLHTLDVSHTSVTHRVFAAARGMSSLHTLSVEHSQVGSLSGVQDLHALEALNIASTPVVTDSLLCLRDHPTLRALNIASTANVHGDQALQYMQGLQLNHLSLPSRLTTTDLGMSAITNMPLLTLELTNYINVGDAGLEHVGQIHSLRRLRLSNTQVSDAGMPFLEGLVNLEELLLDRTSVGDAGVQVIRAFTHLQELSVSETRITDGFLKSHTLDSCIMLSKLNLSRTHVSDKGVVHLRLPHLSLLNLDNTRVTENILPALREHCPQLKSVSTKNLQPPPSSDEEDNA